MFRSDPAVRSELAANLATIKQVRQREYKSILARRVQNGVSTDTDADGTPKDLFGVCLSGGGIRSASFCLGALQALDRYGLVDRMDYLSTVSGGGYAGSSLAAAMGGRNEAFPFAVSSAGRTDVRDSPAVSDIRDHSRFLAPNGAGDFLMSFAIWLRGLMVNLILVTAVLLALAMLVIAFNPTVNDLGRSFVWDTFAFWTPGSIAPGSFKDTLKPYLIDSFLLTKITGVLLLLSLVGWALRRSYVEIYSATGIQRLFEPKSWWALFTQGVLICFCVALAIEVQPIIVGFVRGLLAEDSGTRKAALGLWGTLGTLVGATAVLRGKLANWLQQAMGSPTVGARVQAAIAKFAFYAAGLALPLLIYGFFLAIVIWGLRVSPEGADSPVFIQLTRDGNVLLLLGVLYVFVMSRSLIIQLYHRDLAPKESPIAATVRSLWATPRGRLYIRLFSLWVIILLMALLATRADNYAVSFEAQLFSRDSLPEWRVLACYLLAFLILGAVGMSFTENANGLHRLYRDRLKAAFALHPNGNHRVSLRLHELTGNAPYLLVNGALNVHRSDEVAAEEAGAGVSRTADPAKRGRNAELFLFSRHYVGSDTTGYIDSQSILRDEPQLDLATATAISGAAVSSAMGRFNLGWLGPTLALLNLRLGFWLINPRYVFAQQQALAGKAVKDTRRWDEILRLYLFNEAFARLRADSPRIYITDGGHIENLGLYQLLKRRCRLIIVIDSEADAGMTFRAFSDAQRFARIDEGARVSLDWHPLRDGALKRNAAMAATPPEPFPDYNHFAIGKIKYEDGPEGMLLYVKASVSGDEPDYVLDYERRNNLFPHESTGDQFFSEEQMEAYRALGFHAIQRALDDGFVGGSVSGGVRPGPTTRAAGSSDPGGAPAPKPSARAKAAVGPDDASIGKFKDRLGIAGRNIDGTKS